ncbi:SGNH/GDSL hydrolase family protein [Deminuibacter soli]|uniref:G-D-S-L family lipolytic protein n=1 Tax=Deminuibacter soli TaxID=2291815 RepID=A0A3E1NL64_9BACT|nr:GDSL-type esterase/lipase family protein [Deminuibacter soli]RFM28680.1 G-D-S-L family lipolytic protein [Deminuibacter soli]
MKKILGVGLLVMLIAMVAFKADKKKKVVFFGDSITEAGVKPGGYITVLKDKLAKENINDYELVGAGIGGNKVYDLYLRMETDVLAQQPDIVVIYVGVNDVWHKRSFGTGTDPDKFEKFYRAIIKKLQAQNIKVVICTPATIGERKNFTNAQDGELNQYSEIIRKIAKSESIPVVDLRALFTQYLQTNNPDDKDRGVLTVDGVHLNEKGNNMVADEMWKGITQVK